jgi:hypothetical protein
MGMQKGYRTNINIVNSKIGPPRRQEILDGIADNGTFLPRGVLVEDMDQTFLEYFKSDTGLGLTIDGEKVPVIFLTIQRWTEFTKTWEFTDEYKNIKMPFITIVRKPDIQVGENQAGLWNIPGNRTYTYMKIPTWDGVRHGVTLYQIPQPTSVDILYEVRLFTNRMKDLNRFNINLQKAFHSRQSYINVNGHPMPLHLDSIGDESNIDDFENRRFYVQLFDIKMMGYILDENDFRVIPTINRTLMTTEVEEQLIANDAILTPIRKGNQIVYNFIWEPRSNTEFTFNALYDLKFTQLTNIENISRIVITQNGTTVFDGTILNTAIIFYANDIIKIKVYKSAATLGKLTLIGSTL